MREKRGIVREKAVALKYLPGLPAPFLTAKGGGRLAERLIALAQESGIPVLREKGLVEVLFPLDLGSYVPEAFYEIDAKVFAFVRSIEEP